MHKVILEYGLVLSDLLLTMIILEDFNLNASFLELAIALSLVQVLALEAHFVDLIDVADVEDSESLLELVWELHNMLAI